MAERQGKHILIVRRPPLPPEDRGVALMLRVQRGEPGAFAELVRDFSPTIFARFFRLFRDRQDAEDLTQEVFLRLYRSRVRYQARARFSTWLFHVTQNVARNAIRNRKRRVQLHFGLDQHDDGLTDPPPGREDTPSRPMERREVGRIVRHAVGELRGNQRRALEMHQFQHRSYQQIAAALDLSPKATKSLLYRARLQLKEHLAQRCGSLV